MARTRLALAALLLTLAAPLGAQTTSLTPAAPAEPATEAVAPAPAANGPTFGALTAGAHRQAANDALVMSPAGRAGMGSSKAMMVVGVGALLAGAVIGGTPGTVIMIGGAVIGLVGLYDYLQ